LGNQKRPRHAIVAFPPDWFRAKGRFLERLRQDANGIGCGQADLTTIVSPQRAVCSWDNAQ
jgi:hypothetical protein